jgi:hypothetical protein
MHHSIIVFMLGQHTDHSPQQIRYAKRVQRHTGFSRLSAGAYPLFPAVFSRKNGHEERDQKKNQELKFTFFLREKQDFFSHPVMRRDASPPADGRFLFDTGATSCAQIRTKSGSNQPKIALEGRGHAGFP